MPDDTLTGARLVKAGARGICSPTAWVPCANTCDECERQARAALLRALAEVLRDE